MRRKPNLLFISILAICIISMIVGIGRSISVGTGELQYVTATVTDKGIKRQNDRDIYLIYTETTDNGEVEVFQITDSILSWRWNSSDIYAGIKIGNTYKFGIRGDRQQLLSWYPNIYTYELVDGEEYIIVDLPTYP